VRVQGRFDLNDDFGQIGTRWVFIAWPRSQFFAAACGSRLRVDMPHKGGLESGSAIVLFGDAIGSSEQIGRRCWLAAQPRRWAGTV